MPDTIRILVVDDNPNHTELTAEYLAFSGPFEVTPAESLQALWERRAAGLYDVILLDYNLPDGNGLEALARFETEGYDVPVIMVTGRGDESIAAQAIQRGAVDYVVKTGDYLRLLPALVHKALRTSQILRSNRQSLEQIRYQALLLNNVEDAVVVWDSEGVIRFWNQAAERLFGCLAETRLGQPAAEVYLTACQPAICLEALDAGGPEVERQAPRAAGETVWLSSRVTPLFDAANKPQGYMDISRDITQRRALEARILAAQAQLAQVARLTTVGALAAGVAHHISNPLTTVIAEAQLLKQHAGSTDLVEAAEAIEQAGWRAQEAVRRLIEFSEPSVVAIGPVNLGDTVRTALALVGATVEALGVTVTIDWPTDLPPVQGNARQLEDLWTNLLLWARAAVDDDHTQEIRIRAVTNAAGEAVVHVTMHAQPAGAPAGLSAPAGAVGAGLDNGLELGICREVMRQHGGGLTVLSSPATGTTVTLTFPPRSLHDNSLS